MKTCNDDWIAIDGYDAFGGQGAIRKVRNNITKETGALKKLLNIHANNTERRRRFIREVEILKSLNIDGIPKLLCSNTNSLNEDGDLFYISEWIGGGTLTKYIQSNDLSLSQIVEYIVQLCDLIYKCHKEGIYHRDIKPDNIMVDDNDNVFLVDFGISYKGGIDNFKTKLGQELGNRFFRIPDYAIGMDRKDGRGDITMIVGLFFYLLTKKAPRILLDNKMRPPHVAMESAFSPNIKDSPYWEKINRIFNIGFQPSVDLRFQNVLELKEMCLAIFEAEPIQTSAAKSELEKLKTSITFTAKKLPKKNQRKS